VSPPFQVAAESGQMSRSLSYDPSRAGTKTSEDGQGADEVLQRNVSDFVVAGDNHASSVIDRQRPSRVLHPRRISSEKFLAVRNRCTHSKSRTKKVCRRAISVRCERLSSVMPRVRFKQKHVDPTFDDRTEHICNDCLVLFRTDIVCNDPIRLSCSVETRSG